MKTFLENMTIKYSLVRPTARAARYANRCVLLLMNITFQARTCMFDPVFHELETKCSQLDEIRLLMA